MGWSMLFTVLSFVASLSGFLGARAIRDARWRFYLKLSLPLISLLFACAAWGCFWVARGWSILGLLTLSSACLLWILALGAFHWGISELYDRLERRYPELRSGPFSYLMDGIRTRRLHGSDGNAVNSSLHSPRESKVSPMPPRTGLFPNVIEMNHQARRRLGCCVYLVHDGDDWMLIDIGYQDTLDDILGLIRQLDFRLANCRYLVATHADVDHIQGLKRAKELMPQAQVVGHPQAEGLLRDGERIMTYAEITAQGISIDLPQVGFDRTIDEGDVLTLGNLKLEVWHTPGHAPAQLSFRMGNLLFSGDNIYRDGCVGNIDAHHGSDLPAFIKSLERIKKSDVEWLLPSHGPVFRKDNQMLQKTIDRLTEYQHMADFGTCAVDWPLLDEWDEELARGASAATQS